jgi:hypothetical protein
MNPVAVRSIGPASVATVGELVVARVKTVASQLVRSDITTSIEAIEKQLLSPAGASRRRLIDLFRLTDRDRDTLDTCHAAAIDPSLAAIFETITGRPYVTAPLVACLFGHTPGRTWNPGGALALWELVRAEAAAAGEPEALTIDPVVPAWLGGDLWVDRQLAGVVRTMTTGVRLPSWPVDDSATAIRHAMTAGRPVRIAVSGSPGSGRTLFAAATAVAAGLTPLVVDTAGVSEADWTSIYVRLQRLAAVGAFALIWTGPHANRSWPGVVSPAPVHFVVLDPDDRPARSPQTITQRVSIAETTIDERRAVWRSTVPASANWPASELDALASRYPLGVGEISAIAGNPPSTPAEAIAAARASHQASDDELVHVVSCPFNWDDLVLPAAIKSTLEDLAFEASEREALRADASTSRLFSRELGLVALLSGPSGCGKTMAAQVLASHLDVPLLRVDYAAVQSRYIGDTAKNLNRIFALVRRHSSAVLLFDEADGYFTRRTEVKDSVDRYANGDTNHLLQLIETHTSNRGVVILATNRRSDMDPAIVRRIRHVIEFPRPQAAERRLLWRKALSTVAPKQWNSISARIGRLADAIDVSGAQIKSATLSAAYIARRERGALSFAHVVRGLDRELSKEGRPLAGRDKERWLDHA